MSDRKKVLLHRQQEHPGEPVRITVRHGREHQILEGECALIVAALESDDGVHTYQVLVGDTDELGHIVLAGALSIGQSMDRLAEVLSVELASDYEGTAAAIGRALVMHANWKERQHGEAERDPGDDAGGEDGPGARSP